MLWPNSDSEGRAIPVTGTRWADGPLVALDLEGTGAQDREDEAILEIAVVPLAAGHPSLADAYVTLINPGRPVPRRPWISPGLTDDVLADAPTLAGVQAELAARLNGQYIVGHNIGVDYRLLRRRCPDIRPAGLIDTLRLARRVRPGDGRNGLSALLERHGLTSQANALAPSSRPHRALWDTVGTALLLAALINSAPGGIDLTIDELRRFAGRPLDDDEPVEPAAEQLPLLEL